MHRRVQDGPAAHKPDPNKRTTPPTLPGPVKDETVRRWSRLCVCAGHGGFCVTFGVGFYLVMEAGGSGEIFNIYGPLRVVWELKD